MKSGMEYLKLLIISCLLFNAAMAIKWEKAMAKCFSNSSEYRLPVTVANCRHYNIRIMPPPMTRNYDNHYYGDFTYTIQIYQMTRNISLHASPTIFLNKETTSLTQYSPYIIHTPVEYVYCETTEILTIIFDTDLWVGQYALNLRFIGILTTPDENGFNRITYEDNNGIERKLMVTNFFWNARSVFPCWDEPTFKATFDISVMHPPSYTILSNMPIKEQDDTNDMTWTYFYTTPLTATYLVGIVMFDGFTSISNEDLPVRVWGNPEKIWKLQNAYEIVEQCLNYINTNTNLTKILKMDHVAIPSPINMMKYNWGLYTYKESNLLYNENSTYIRKGSYMEYQMAHTIAHQLFRSMNSPIWWNYEPLNDGIATLFGLYVIDKIFGQTQFMDYFIVEMQQQLLSKDVRSYMSPIILEVNTPQEIEFFLSYGSRKKATVIMHMMSHIVSNEFFMSAISRYWRNNESKSISLDDLWKAFEGISMTRHIKFDSYNLKTAMINWLFNSNYPVVHVNTHKGSITVRQEHFCKQTTDKDELWWIPITYTHESSAVFNETMPIFWLKPDLPSREIYGVPEDNWIIVNLQQTGYYRVNYNIDNWEKLTKCLNSDAYTKIHPINRAQIIDDSYHLMLENIIHPLTFLELSSYLERERDYIPWYPMKKIFSDMSTFFQYPESEYIKQHMTTILNGVLRDLGFEERNNESDFTKRLRLLVVELTCQIGLAKCFNAANVKLSTYLDNPQAHIHEISTPWRNWFFCMGMAKMNMHYWNKMLDKFLSTGNIQYLEYLICADDPIIIISYMDRLISNNIPLLDFEDSIRITYSIVRRHITKDLVFTYILTNFNRIEHYQSESILEVVIQSIHSSKQLEQLKEFVANHTESMMPKNWSSVWRFNEDYSIELMSAITERLKQLQQEIYIYIHLFDDVLKTPKIY